MPRAKINTPKGDYVLVDGDTSIKEGRFYSPKFPDALTSVTGINYNLLLAGDQQSGTDFLLLKGDQQSGADIFLGLEYT